MAGFMPVRYDGAACTRNVLPGVAVRLFVRSVTTPPEALPWTSRGSAPRTAPVGRGGRCTPFPAGGGPAREAVGASRADNLAEMTLVDSPGICVRRGR